MYVEEAELTHHSLNHGGDSCFGSTEISLDSLDFAMLRKLRRGWLIIIAVLKLTNVQELANFRDKNYTATSGFYSCRVMRNINW